MKIKFSLLASMTAAVALLTASTASAFPLYLTSASGTISYTPSYSAIAGTNVNSAKISTVSVNLKTLMTVISNQLYLNVGSNAFPASAKIVYDPYAFKSYLTNSSGASQSLSGIVSVSLDDIATSFRGTGQNSGTESDKVSLSLEVRGYAPDGKYFEFQVSGVGMLNYSLTKANKGTMSISLPNGGGYGENAGSDDGVATGGFMLRGTGTPEWTGPYSTWWY